MSCSDREARISAYVDGELEPSPRAELEAHLASCTVCTGRVHELHALSRAIRAGASAPEPDASLVRRLAGSLRAEPGDRRARARSFATHLLVAAAAAVLAWTTALGWGRASEERRIGEEVVSAHVRSLLADHLTDVASSDRHTVNPWFQGKIDFGAGARDHADRGFALEGGRLDYVDGRAVASFVYRRNLHALNLFVWPSRSSGSGADARFSSRGFHAVHWRSDGMERWLVSDADPATIEEFAQLVRSDG